MGARRFLPLYLTTLLVVLPGCAEPPARPEPWTLADVHKTVGLEGGHQVLACRDCHEPGALQAAVSVTCEACHLDLYEAATDPDHVALGYATRCAQCHDSRAWRPSFYDHSAFGFALEGAHRRTLCAGCHPPETPFGPLPTDCWSCHEAAVADADPDHAALGFSRQCQDCHTTTDWRTEAFDHEAWFPLRRGDHRRYRSDCGACHLQPAAYAVFTCTQCHDGEHDQGRTDRQHDEVRRYRYDSVACYECHPRGSEDDSEGGDD